MTTTYIDLDLHNLPPHIDQYSVKKITGAKHIISTDLKHDAMRGTCTGDGRLRLRLLQDEDLNQIRSNLAMAGIRTGTHQENPQKNPELTGNSANPKNPLII